MRNHIRTILGIGLPALLGTLALAGCSDTSRAHFTAWGQEGRVSCFSGGKLVFDDFSTGKVQTHDGGAGYEFKSITTQRLEQVSGMCVVDYGATPPAGWHATLPDTAIAASAPSVAGT